MRVRAVRRMRSLRDRYALSIRYPCILAPHRPVADRNRGWPVFDRTWLSRRIVVLVTTAGFRLLKRPQLRFLGGIRRNCNRAAPCGIDADSIMANRSSASKKFRRKIIALAATSDVSARHSTARFNRDGTMHRKNEFAKRIPSASCAQASRKKSSSRMPQTTTGASAPVVVSQYGKSRRDQ